MATTEELRDALRELRDAINEATECLDVESAMCSTRMSEARDHADAMLTD